MNLSGGTEKSSNVNRDKQGNRWKYWRMAQEGDHKDRQQEEKGIQIRSCDSINVIPTNI